MKDIPDVREYNKNNLKFNKTIKYINAYNAI